MKNILQEQRSVVVGIDFGTTGLRVAALVNGRPVILENEEGEGTTPAFVAFGKNGAAHVGEVARLTAAHSLDVIWAVKRLVGRSWTDSLVQSLKAAAVYPLVEMDDGTAGVEIAGQRRSPGDLCAFLFDNLRKTACRQLKNDVRQAVVAVPAHFGIEQRRILSESAASVGLEVLRFLPEPTAAALFHGLGDAERTVAVFDLGGGTFDISILEIGDGVFDVLSSDGDPLLGGEDFDVRLRDHMLERVGLRIDDLSRASRYHVKREAELAKVALSGHSECRVVAPHLTTIDGRPVALDLVITRDSLRDLCQDLVDRALLVCTRAVAGANEHCQRVYHKSFALEDLDEVVLVGGSTRLPFVEECVERYFGKKPMAPRRREDAVALGCAVQAGVLFGDVKNVLLLDVLPRSYGVRIGGEAVVVLLHRNTTIPTKKDYLHLGVLLPNKPLSITAVELSEDGSERVVAAMTLDEVGHKGGQIRLSVSLDVDANGMLRLDATDAVSGNKGTTRAAAISKMASQDLMPASLNSRAFPAAVKRTLPLPQQTNRLRILAVGTEWRSGAGGLSSMNRELCQALAAAGHDVFCLVLNAEPAEFASASMKGVRLVTATKRAGQSDQVALARRPVLQEGWRPDLVIGHGRITGPAAAALTEDHFPEAKRLHIIHMAPDEIEWFKPDRGDDAGVRAEERTRIECELGASAHHVAAVGPRLHGRFLTDFHPLARSLLRLDPGFDGEATVPLGPPPGHPWRVLLVGRAEDEELKGLDIAARAMGLLFPRWRGVSLELNVRGARPGTSEELRGKLLRWAEVSGLAINVRPYDAVAEKLEADYRRASLVLMPSRSEGFGLVGLEAICAGVPVLVSKASGLGELLAEELPPEEATRIVVPVTGALEQDADVWSHAVEQALYDREAAFTRARAVLQHLQQARKWKRTVEEIGSAILQKCAI